MIQKIIIIICIHTMYICTYVRVSYSMYTYMHTDGPCSMYVQVYIHIYATHSTYSGSGMFTVCGISTVRMACSQWEWQLYSGSGISTVGVANSRYGTIHSLALRPVPYLQLHMHSDPQYITPDNPLK